MIDELRIQWIFNLEEMGSHPNKMGEWFDYLVQEYTSEPRKYHGLGHIHHMLELAEKIKSKVEDWDSFYFAIWFHDVIQDKLLATEMLSAEKCCMAMLELGLDKSAADRAARLILATKSHDQDYSGDVKLFVDLDLSILGAPRKEYSAYANQCRQEFNIPNWLYRKGRIELLRKFLNKKRIYKSDCFWEELEANARSNISYEMEILRNGGLL
ncbi:hypothetical protein A3715_20575 [Oleiphilus sp. HI0009]|uniref:HD domain-containing protein n=1 Tax=unclassified Oleiphilus TaxID=2631174 RepID=UPI0007C3A11E|nr:MULTISPECIES: hypothetical protein [unclassified Oleiphilus]KZX76142.1 hypothetical protein A3715_13525 [Oleiphilus sp. HI0009]KZX77945.1 hypothetical protein A3715_20575 [Oleiphilus sp. HI0009]KZY67941.1 hypothetical protein A3739_11475 [Oleiphilus sp. HI0067]KZY71702.1 hypothetical protein A3738_03305 [Oleiphilus sp. HI0066]